jgi:carbonic anhydrase
MRRALFPLVLLAWCLSAAAAQAPGGGGAGLAPDEALKILQNGNARYVEGKPQHPHQNRERRALTFGQGQHPLAAVLACSDSRVPVELIFDQGIGDLFVVRVAGNVAQADELGSLEYAAGHLAVPLVVVLGHSQCGAVTAVVDNLKLTGHLAAPLGPVKAAVAKAKADHPGLAGEALVNAAVQANVWQAVEDLLQKSSEVKALIKAGKLKVVGAVYELDTGQVQWLGPHPEQNRLLGVKGKAGAAPKPPGRKGQK